MMESGATQGVSVLLSPQQIVETALAAATTDGCIVVVNTTGEANIRWANNTVTTNGIAQTMSWFVVAVSGGAAGTVAASAAAAESTASIAQVVRAAEEAARASAASGPARDAQPLVTGGADDAFALPAEGTTFEVYSGLIDGLARAFDEARSGDRILYGFARHELTTTYLGSSTGLRRRWVQPTGTLEVNAKSADLSRSSWAGMSTADFTDVDVLAMSTSLADRLGWAQRQVDLPPGRYETVLPPTAVGDFMIPFAWGAAARPAHEGRSALSKAGGGTRLGERLTERAFSLYGDPTEQGIECAPFLVTGHSADEISVFDNGAPVGRTSLLADGVFSGLLQTRGSAAEYGEDFSPFADNLVLTGGDQSRSTLDLVADIDRGLLVTSQWYLREVDPMTMLMTGLTRDGVFLVEGGEITAAVNNFRFNMSPLEVLRQAGDVGRTERCLSREWSDWFTRTAMPSIRVEGFNMSSVSAAR